MTRLVSFVPRLAVLTVVWLLATAALTFAAGQRLTSAPAAAPQGQQAPTTTAATTPTPAVLVVPDVRRQAYVFAKGMLQDAGFAWKVTGKVKGYAANTVVAESPAPGTQVVDTGAPTITLQLVSSGYPAAGAPEEASPYAGTPIELPGAPATATRRESAARQPETARPAKAAKPAHAKRARTSEAWPAKRPPAFKAPGARPEPLDEMPLPERARRLSAWLAREPKPTNANVSHWLYQHAWIVTGAREGWWHGADALRILLQADGRVERLWGIGGKSAAAARAALAEVEARSS